MVVNRGLPAIIVKPIIWWMITKCPLKHLWVPDQGATGLKRCVKPFVRIDRNRVRLIHSLHVVVAIGKDCGKPAISSIDVVPEIIFAGDDSKLLQRVDCTCADRTCISDNHERQESLLEIVFELTLQGPNIDSLILIRAEVAQNKINRFLYIPKMFGTKPMDRVVKITVEDDGVDIDTREFVG